MKVELLLLHLLNAAASRREDNMSAREKCFAALRLEYFES